MKVKFTDNKIFIKDENRAFLNATFCKNSKTIFIELLKVERDYRNKNVGTRVLKRSLEFFEKKGFQKVVLNVLPLDSNSLNLVQLKNFYKKHGFIESPQKALSRPNLMIKYII